MKLLKVLVVSVGAMLSVNVCMQTSTEQRSDAAVESVSKSPAHEDTWRPGNLKGLVVGKATREEFLKVFGTPISTSRPTVDLPEGEDSSIVDEFHYPEPFEKLQAFFSPDTMLLTGMVLVPSKMTLDDLVAIYGNQYVVTKYKFIECLGDAGSSMVIEDREGSVTYYEYRSLGMIVSVSDADGSIRFIEFVSGPLDTGKARCD